MRYINLSLLLFILFLGTGCIGAGKKGLDVKFKDPSVAFGTNSANVTSVSVQNNQLIINGSGLDNITEVKLSRNGVIQNLTVESSTLSQLVAKGAAAVSIGVDQIFDLVLSNASGSATFPVSFTLDDHSVDLAKLKVTGASNGQILKYNGTSWAPASLTETQNYIGTWDASNNTGGVPDLSVVSSTAGDYYIVSVAGTLGGISYAAGDWIVSDGSSWQKIPASTLGVTSFQGRKGVVVLTPADYVQLKDTGTNKVTGSKIADVADVDLTGISDGNVLRWDATASKWKATAAASTSGIALTDLSATAPLTYSNTTGVFSLSTADLLAQPLTGLTAGSSTSVTASDTLLGAFGKLMSVPNDYVSKSSGAAMTTGTIALSGTAMITVPTATGTTLSEVTNVSYVNSAISTAVAANGVWAKGTSSSINYTSGNVGIGTTTPNQALSVSGNALITGSIYASGIQNTSSNVNAQVNPTSTGTQILRNVGDANPTLVVHQQSSSSTGDILQLKNSSSTLVTVQKGGNVGIGTTSPGSLLTVAGASSFSGNISAVQNIIYGAGQSSGTYGLYFVNTGGQDYWASTYGGSNTLSAQNGILLRTNGSGANISLTPASSGNTLITSGNVGIGASTPAQKLHVNGNIVVPYSSGSIGISGADGTAFLNKLSQNNAITLLTNNEASGFNFVNSSATSLLRVDGSGRVGIGTITPTNRLSVTPSQYSTGTASQSGTTVTGSGTTWTSGMVGSQLVYADGTSAGTITGFTDATHLTVSTSQTIASQSYGINYTGLQVNSTGYAGVGTTAPTHGLTLGSATNGLALYNTADQTTNYSRLVLKSAVNGNGLHEIVGEKGGSGTAYGLQLSTSGTVLRIGGPGASGNTDSAGLGIYLAQPNADGVGIRAAGQVSNSTGTNNFLHLIPTITQGGTAGYNTIYSAVYESTTGSGVKNLINLGTSTATLGGGTVTPKFTVSSSGNGYFYGNLGIGTAASASIPLYVNTATAGATVATFQNGTGSCTVVPDSGMSCSSDIALKENIKEIMNGLDRVLNLRGVTFQWKERGTKDNSRHIGFIAQEVEAVAPELVKEDHRGYKQVNYANFVAVLTEAIKGFYQKWIIGNEKIYNEIAILKRQMAAKDKLISSLSEHNQEISKALLEMKREQLEIKKSLNELKKK
jgi:trimeric autotransporter adhesin